MKHKIEHIANGQLLEAIQTTPKGTTELELGGLGLGSDHSSTWGSVSGHIYTTSELKTGFAAIPSSVRSLDLRSNNFFMKKEKHVFAAISAIPNTVTSLNFSTNYLGMLGQFNLAQLIASLPEGINSLNLTNNNLGNLSGDSLATAFPIVNPAVRYLDLSENFIFANKSPEQAAEICKSLPPTLTALNLSKNNLNQIKLETWHELANTIPHVETLYLSQKELDAMTTEQLSGLKSAFPSLKELILTDEKGKLVDGNDLRVRANLAIKYGFSAQPPSLKEIGAAFFRKTGVNVDEQPIPNELKDFIKKP
ncbi:hypothetical protein [Legionella cincinnatiensis]|uniref:Leucine-rich repeat-containing protein n=1 Tax=Legionella cincinnatiensis TaxID=28085 RepID=A0A378IQK2_9GAMM|nr:hypothetical protein [Legionella cincinnatiensis]KTC92358.1 leucine-rich repeat-containing protein [Legionella cincinnatiensis]STX36761.1 leucine-rich repeat-containing protein (substrate of the Dot/Icm secretion system) [Legionella cincinnatiensis]